MSRVEGSVLELILGSERFRIRASEAAQPQLLEVAETVNTRVKGLREGGAALSTQRAALMAAFQFASELKELKERVEMGGDEKADLTRRIDEMIDSIDRGLIEAES